MVYIVIGLALFVVAPVVAAIFDGNFLAAAWGAAMLATAAGIAWTVFGVLGCIASNGLRNGDHVLELGQRAIAQGLTIAVVSGLACVLLNRVIDPPHKRQRQE